MISGGGLGGGIKDPFTGEEKEDFSGLGSSLCRAPETERAAAETGTALLVMDRYWYGLWREVPTETQQQLVPHSL